MWFSLDIDRIRMPGRFRGAVVPYSTPALHLHG